MGYLVSDQNQTGIFFESGTYANPTGATLQWIGFMQDSTIDESIPRTKIRYTGTTSRNVSALVTGPEDYKGTLSFYPQNWRMLAFALGSCLDAGSPSPYTHVISETNSNTGNYATSGVKAPFVSFTIEDAHIGQTTGSSFLRTVKGCVVDTLSISASEGELVSCEVGYIGQNLTFSSGAATTLTADTSRPFKWQDCQVHIPSGTIVQGLKDFSWSIANNLVASHYLNGSVVIEQPIPTNRDYEFTLTCDENSDQIKTFYDAYFKGGSSFNAMLQITNFGTAGSADLFIIMSGCALDDMSAPTKNEGINENSLTIIPKNAIANINDQTQLYNAW